MREEQLILGDMKVKPLARSRSEWKELVLEGNQSGIPAREFCMERGLSYERFRRWSTRFERESGEQELASRADGFREVSLSGVSASSAHSWGVCGGYECAIGSRYVLRIPEVFNEESLSRLIGILGREG